MKNTLSLVLSATVAIFALTACDQEAGAPVVVGETQVDTVQTVFVPDTTDSDTSYNDGYDDGYADGSADSGDDSGDDGGSYYSSGDTGGCDASGCNSFGSGGSKNTGLLQAKVSQAQMTAKANSVASQFQMSFESAYKLTQLAVQVQGMKQQRQLTQADRDAVTQGAFKIAGVTSDQVNAAVAASLSSGDQSAVESVMSTAAQNLGMPSSQTFRDKLLPLISQ